MTIGKFLGIVVVAICLPASIVGMTRIPIVSRVFWYVPGGRSSVYTASYYYAGVLGWIVCPIGIVLSVIVIVRHDCGIWLKLAATSMLVLAIAGTIYAVSDLSIG